jgi:hypothetical protein
MSPEFASLSHIRLSFLGSILLLPGITAYFFFYFYSIQCIKVYEIIFILYSSLKSLPFSAKTLIVEPVVVNLGAKDKAAFLNEENVSVLPVGT